MSNSIIKSIICNFLYSAYLFLTFIVLTNCLFAEEGTFPDFDSQWGAHIRLIGNTEFPGSGSYYNELGSGPMPGYFSEVRLKNKLYTGEKITTEVHYEAAVTGGEKRERRSKLSKLYPGISSSPLFSDTNPNDERRLFGLTDTIDETPSSYSYHRIDRLSVTYEPDWGTISAGRQGLSWGNGFLFNPMDLFSPFSPSDFSREYKTGSDMIVVTFSLIDDTDLQLLYIPGRNPDTGNVEENYSSYASKLHFSSGTTEFDIMAAKHFGDTITGAGLTTYIADAVFRTDATWSFTEGVEDNSGYLAVVSNIDYSWVWFGKNVYGFIEFFHNSDGHTKPSNSILDSGLLERVERGELYTLGKSYLGSELKVELHPLFNIFLTAITNLNDNSGNIQIRGSWDITQNIQIIAGGVLNSGGSDSEYGGFTEELTGLKIVPSDSVYLWITRYF